MASHRWNKVSCYMITMQWNSFWVIQPLDLKRAAVVGPSPGALCFTGCHTAQIPAHWVAVVCFVWFGVVFWQNFFEHLQERDKVRAEGGLAGRRRGDWQPMPMGWGKGCTREQKKGSPYPRKIKRMRCSESPWSGWLGSCVSNRRHLLPSICSKYAIWKLPRTIWKPLIRKVTGGGRELHLDRWGAWLSPSIPDWGSGHFYGFQARPSSPLLGPSRSGTTWTLRQQGAKLLSLQVSKKHPIRPTWYTRVQALGQSRFVTLEYLDMGGMWLHLESCPSSYKSAGLISCTAYRNKSDVFIIALQGLCSMVIRVYAL